MEFIFDTRLIERTLELEICDTFTVIVFNPGAIGLAEIRVMDGVRLELTI